MIIHSYVMTMPDDVDVLPDALTSLSKFSDRIYVVDGGMGGGTLCHQPRYTEPINAWLMNRPEFSGYGLPFVELKGDAAWSDKDIERLKEAIQSTAEGSPLVFVKEPLTYEISNVTWEGTPLVTYVHDWQDPAHQRNWTLARMARDPQQPDWIVWIDADEVCSWEFITGVRDLLEHLPSRITNITVRWLTLVQDEQHCVKHMSDWLAHSRIHRPGSVIWGGAWHEHGNFTGDRYHWEQGRVIHTRALFTHRLKVQRGHDGIASGATPLWANAEMIDIPAGVTWQGLLHWPEDETPTPFR